MTPEQAVNILLVYFGLDYVLMLEFYSRVIVRYGLVNTWLDTTIDLIDAWLIDREPVPPAPTVAEVMTWEEDL